MSHELPFGFDVPYWKTSKSSPDVWIERTVRLLRELGALGINEAFASYDGRASFVIVFSFGGENFRVAWPVLHFKDAKDERAARVQAATLLYHDCKAKAVAAKALGVRTAFVGELLLPHGKTVKESALPVIAEHVKPVALIGVNQ